MTVDRGAAAVSSNVAALGYRLAGVLLLSVALAILSDAFLTASNLLNVLRQASLNFLIASGLTLVIVAAGLDLSIGANVGLSACLAAVASKSTGSIAAGSARSRHACPEPNTPEVRAVAVRAPGRRGQALDTSAAAATISAVSKWRPSPAGPRIFC